MRTVEYRLPAYWACPMINGDLSGLSHEEEQAFYMWLADHGDAIRGAIITCSDDSPEFCNWHDARGYELPCDCLTFTFTYLEEVSA